MGDGAIGRFRWVVIDSVDPDRIAPFWCALLGVEEAGWFDANFLCLTDADGGAPPVAFQRVPEAKAVKNRVHLDLSVDDLDDAARRIEALGGRAVSEVLEVQGYRWRVMADPEGNEFCITPKPDEAPATP
jgi:predicted enzyme related to lactoylglutathione lyase